MTPQVQREIVFVFKLRVLVCAFERDLPQAYLRPLIRGRFPRQIFCLTRLIRKGQLTVHLCRQKNSCCGFHRTGHWKDSGVYKIEHRFVQCISLYAIRESERDLPRYNGQYFASYVFFSSLSSVLCVRVWHLTHTSIWRQLLLLTENVTWLCYFAPLCCFQLIRPSVVFTVSRTRYRSSVLE